MPSVAIPGILDPNTPFARKSQAYRLFKVQRGRGMESSKTGYWLQVVGNFGLLVGLVLVAV